MTPTNRLSALAVTERNALETLLMEFDQAWAPGLLPDYFERMKSEASDPYLRLALSELVKIDLQRRWSVGQGKMLEEYIEHFPLLGSANTIDPELILIEFNSRRSADGNMKLESYLSRYPQQYEELVRLAAKLDSDAPAKGNPVQASIETSRIGNSQETKAPTGPVSAGLPVEFGRYRILRELGSGAMGVVSLAHDTQLDRQVALKTPSFQSENTDEMVTRFYREARAAAKIQHRNICPIYDVGEIDGQHFISMAFIKGRTMSDLIQPDKLPPPKTSAVLVHRLALALAEAHRHNVIHRDLKPANIMIDKKREPVVMDFGLARQTDVESRMTQSGMLLGTPAYMSPEQLSGNPDDVGAQSDIYALGVILYELLTGTLPFNGTLAQVVCQILQEEPKPPSQMREEVSPELEAICAKMMAKDREERFQTMDKVAAAIKKHLTGSKEKQSQGKSADSKSSQVIPRKSPGESVSETGVLNEFFAAQAASDPLQTSMESLPSQSPIPMAVPLKPLAAPTKKSVQLRPARPKPASGKGFFHSRAKWISAGLIGAFLFAAALGIVFFVKTPYGTIRVETFGDLEGIEVLVDGNTINLTGSEKLKVKDHALQLKLNDTFLKLDPVSNQFVISKDGDHRKLSVTIGTVQLSSTKFTIDRNKETIIKIELLPAGPNGTLLSSNHGDNSNSARNTDPPTAPANHPESGFISLFNGNDLTGWSRFTNDKTQILNRPTWKALDGELVVDEEDYSSLLTDQEFVDFELRFDFQFSPNSKPTGKDGKELNVLVRTQGPHLLPLKGLEQWQSKMTPAAKQAIQDRGGKIILHAIAIQCNLRSGTLGAFGTTIKHQVPVDHKPHNRMSRAQALSTPTLAPEGNWNSCVVTCLGDSMSVKVNGELVNEANGLETVPGKIGLKHYNGTGKFRDIRVRKIEPPERAITNSVDFTNMTQRTIEAQSDVRLMTLAPDAKSFATSGSDSRGEVSIWDALTGEKLNRFRVSEGDIADLSYSRDGKCLVVGSGSSVRIVSSNDGALVKTIDFASYVRFVPFPNRNWIACMFLERPAGKKEAVQVPKIISIWDWETNEKLYEGLVKQVGGQSPNWPAVSSDGKYLTIGMRGHHVRYEIVVDNDSVSLQNSTSLQPTSLVRGSLVFSPDGILAVTPLKKKERALFAVLDIQTGRVLHELDSDRASEAGMGCRLKFMPDGEHVVATDMEGGVSIWNCKTGELASRLYSHQEGLARQGAPGVLVTPDGRIITGGGPNDRRLIFSQFEKPDSRFEGFGRRAAQRVIERGGSIGLNKLKQITELARLPAGPLTIIHVSFCKVKGSIDEDLTLIAHLPNLLRIDLDRTVLTDAGVACLKNLKSLRTLWLRKTGVTNEGLKHIAGLSNLIFLNLDQTSITDVGLPHLSNLNNLGSLSLIETRVTDRGLSHLESLTNLKKLNLSGTRVTAKGIAEVKKALPSCIISFDASLGSDPVEAPTALSSPEAVFTASVDEAKGYDKRSIYAVAFSPTGEIVDSAIEAGTLRFRNVVTGDVIPSPIDRHNVQAVAWSNDGSRLALGLKSGLVEVWKDGAAGPAYTFQVPNNRSIRSVAFSPDDSVVIALGAESSMFACSWSLEDRSPLVNIVVKNNGVLHNRRVFGSDINSDRSLAALASGYGVQIWSLKKDQLLLTIVADGASDKGFRVGPVGFSRDGQRIGWADARHLRIAEVSTGTILHEIVPSGQIYAVAFAPNGKEVVTCSNVFKHTTGQDGVVEREDTQHFEVWDMNNGTQLRRWSCPGGFYTRHLVFSADGRYLAAAGYGFPLRVWDMRKRAPGVGTGLPPETGAVIEPSTEVTRPTVELGAEASAQVRVGRTLSPSELLTSEGWEWSAPVNLGDEVNSSVREMHPNLSGDGRTLLFTRYQQAGGNVNLKEDIWQAVRPNETSPWSKAIPLNLGDTTNRQGNPELSSDGLTILFCNYKSGGSGKRDIWEVRRPTRDAAWGQPVNLGATVNSSAKDGSPDLSDDGLTMLFDSEREGGLGGTDLWMCTRPSIDASWSPPVNLGPNVNTSEDDSGPSLASDGLALIYACDGNLRVARRNHATGHFGEAVEPIGWNWDGDVNSPCLTVDGRTLYFSSGRQTTNGGKADIWMCRRTPKIQDR